MPQFEKWLYEMHRKLSNRELGQGVRDMLTSAGRPDGGAYLWGGHTDVCGSSS